eukprot:5201480-Amphidinium_carterae.1
MRLMGSCCSSTVDSHGHARKKVSTACIDVFVSTLLICSFLARIEAVILSITRSPAKPTNELLLKVINGVIWQTKGGDCCSGTVEKRYNDSPDH